MRRVIAVGIAASTMAISVLTLVDAAAGAPTKSEVDDTVRALEADGYDVIVNRTGIAVPAGCTVAAVRPGVSHTVYVDVAC